VTDDSTAYDDPWDQDTPDPAEDPDFRKPSGPLGDWNFDTEKPVKEMEPDDANAAFYEQVHEWIAAGKYEFDIDELFPLMNRTGKSRPWLYTKLNKAVQDQLLRKHGRSHWVINRAGGTRQ
jgi:hypothetical protein